jgi:hypothetical protein
VVRGFSKKTREIPGFRENATLAAAHGIVRGETGITVAIEEDAGQRMSVAGPIKTEPGEARFAFKELHT